MRFTQGQGEKVEIKVTYKTYLDMGLMYGERNLI